MADNLIPDILKARFVGVLDPSGLQKRQLPVDIGDESELIIQFGEDNMLRTFMELTDLNPNFQKEYQSFEANLKILTATELHDCLKCKFEEMLNLMSSTVSCVGCRRSVECVFQLVSDMSYQTLSPIKLRKHQDNSVFEFTLENDYLVSPKKLFMLLYVCKPNMEFLVNNIPKSRKNKRCNLHCLDSHKVKGVGMWMDFWRSLNADCRDEIVTINIDAFVEALDSYLQKHRFCQECKGKVERAYKLLLKDVKPDENDQEYNEGAFSGIKVCKADRHLHIDSRDDIVSNLITRAEPELSNSSRRERHAKTMDVAQEEVLICLGIVLHEKLHKLNQKVRAEEQTWLILVNTCLESLKRHLVLAIEEKRGYSNMDLFLLEHEEETKKREMKKEMKREKKRKKKQAKKTGSDVNSTGGQSPSKDGFGLFADDDDDEEDDEEEEEEEEEFSKEVPKSSSKDASKDVASSHEDSVDTDWQVVDNQCKQCNRQQRSRVSNNAASDPSSSSRSNPGKGLSCTSNVINRHTNGSPQVSKANVGPSGKKKQSNSNNNSSAGGGEGGHCCGDGKSSKIARILSASHPRNIRCLQPQVIAANNKRLSCTRLSAKSPTDPSAAINGVTSSCSSSSSSHLSSQSSQSPYAGSGPCQLSQSKHHHEGSPNSHVHRGGCSRKNGLPATASSAPSPLLDACCRVAAAVCSSSSPTSGRRLAQKGGSCSASGESDRRARRSEAGAKECGKEGGGHHVSGTHLGTEDADNGEDFLTEQERIFYENNWEEIKEERERLRNKLRQAWSEKTKTTG